MEKAIERVVKLDKQVDVVRAKRAAAVAEAIEKGASLRELAQRLGVSPETVRKLRDAG